MGFEKFGKIGYVSQTKVAPFISYLEKGQIVASRCRECGTVNFPPRADCLECGKSIIEWIPIDGNAKLVTFTEVHFAPPVFQDSTPYLLGVAEIDKGLRVFAPISSEIGRGELKPNLMLVLRPKRSGEGVFYQLERRTDVPRQVSNKQSA